MFKYNCEWGVRDALQIEMAAIKYGGVWTNADGQKCGLGLSHHYEQMRRILWPHLDGDHNGQRWHTLIKKEVLKNKVTVLMGAGSASKTHSAAWLYLCDYFCHPDDTLVLVSSTDMRGLRLRVWGEITMLWQSAVEAYPYLPGHLIDSRIAITTDRIDLEEEPDERTVRDMRKGIIGIPTVQGGKSVGLGKWCISKGTLIDTPSGRIPIEQIKVGDSVFSAAGIQKVRATCSRLVSKVYRVWMSDGTHVDCTGNHRWLTSSGWQRTDLLLPNDSLISTHEAMRLWLVPQIATTKNSGREKGCVFERARVVRIEVLEQASDSRHSEGERGYRVHNLEVEGHPSYSVQGWLVHNCGIKQKRVRLIADECFVAGTMIDTPSGQVAIETIKPGDYVLNAGGVNVVRGCLRKTASNLYRVRAGGRNIVCTGNHEFFTNAGWVQACQLSPSHYIVSTHEAMSILQEHVRPCEQQSRVPAVPGDEDHAGLPRMSAAVPGAESEQSRTFLWNELRAKAFTEAAGVSSQVLQQREESESCEGAWVDDCQVLEQDDFDGYRTSESGVAVYTLEVDGHHTYSVHGFCVANCQLMGSSFLSAFANLNKNEDFRAIILGNPIDMLDPLGRAAEPLDGWSAHMEPDKTSVWKTRFMNGTCVNLVGTDSPNFDFPGPTRFKYLISKEKIDDTLSFFSKDSFEYYSQCVGVMKIGTMARRVLTRQLCEQNHAFDDVIAWEGARTRIYAVDAAYGGDRCVACWGEFGKCIDGKVRLLVHAPTIIPISATSEKEPEYQIAEFVKRECEGIGIQPENMFHDATGRGSLGTALARVWSSAANPVEFGGSPSERAVSQDHYMRDLKTRMRRLKLCKEHYVKFVSELWFSVRYTIEADQLRGLTEETMEEGCMREWNLSKDSRIELETKTEMKSRVGRSPDLMDCLSIILEGARRKGFQISKLSNQIEKPKAPQLLEEIMARQRRLLQSKELATV